MAVNLNLELTDHCNIKCRMCSQSMPMSSSSVQHWWITWVCLRHWLINQSCPRVNQLSASWGSSFSFGLPGQEAVEKGVDGAHGIFFHQRGYMANPGHGQ